MHMDRIEALMVEMRIIEFKDELNKLNDLHIDVKMKILEYMDRIQCDYINIVQTHFHFFINIVYLIS